jgi:two-component system response regulator RegX3
MQRNGGRQRPLTVGDIRLDVRAYLVHVCERPVPLSRREMDVLDVLMSNAGRVVSFQSLYRAVWGRDEAEDFRSLKTHVLRLRRKIEADPHAPTHIRTVRGVGYVFDRLPLTTPREVPDAAGTPDPVPRRP